MQIHCDLPHFVNVSHLGSWSLFTVTVTLDTVSHMCAQENMFHQFCVPKRHWTYMRFFWFKDNDSSEELVEYYACVHLQGLKGSPAIADVGRRYGSQLLPPDRNVFRMELDNPGSGNGVMILLIELCQISFT